MTRLPIHGNICVVVEADERGRILIPAEMRRKFKTKRYKINAKKNRLELEPLQEVDESYLYFANKLKSDWESLEEKGDEFVSKGRR